MKISFKDYKINKLKKNNNNKSIKGEQLFINF